MSKALYREFLRPLLLVGLFAPAEELSAAAVLGTFYFYSPQPRLSMLNSRLFHWIESLCNIPYIPKLFRADLHLQHRNLWPAGISRLSPVPKKHPEGFCIGDQASAAFLQGC